jgi:hypothetical protein
MSRNNLRFAHFGTRFRPTKPLMGDPALEVKDALRELHGAGLVHLHAELVLVTRAAQRIDQLNL